MQPPALAPLHPSKGGQTINPHHVFFFFIVSNYLNFFNHKSRSKNKKWQNVFESSFLIVFLAFFPGWLPASKSEFLQFEISFVASL